VVTRQPRRVELIEQVARATHALAPARQPQRMGQPRQCGADRLVTVGERHGPMALGEPGTVGAEHERHVRVPRDRQPEQSRQQDLAGRRVGQIGARTTSPIAWAASSTTTAS
jgi:hypothetical protein